MKMKDPSARQYLASCLQHVTSGLALGEILILRHWS